MFNDITVILPVYNGGALLAKSVASVLSQKEANFQLLISDDGSTDGSVAYLSPVAEQHSNVQLFVQEKNLGLFGNLNFLIGHSTSKLIHLWSQDDMMAEYCLCETIAFHNRFPAVGMSYSDRFYIDEDDAIIADDKIDSTPSVISTALYSKISIKWGCIAGNIANVTLNKECLDKVGLFNEQLKVSGDFDMFTRIAEHYDIGFIAKKLIYLRRHNQQLSRNVASSYFFIKEDSKITRKLVTMLADEDKQVGKFFFNWRTKVFYLNEVISLALKGHHADARKIFGLLKNEGGLIILSFRWFLVRVLRVLKADMQFYKFFERKLEGKATK